MEKKGKYIKDDIIEIKFIDNGEDDKSEIIEPVFLEPENIVDVIMRLKITQLYQINSRILM